MDSSSSSKPTAASPRNTPACFRYAPICGRVYGQDVCIVHIDGYHVDIPPQGRMIASAILLLRYRANSAWLLLGGAILGLMLGK